MAGQQTGGFTKTRSKIRPYRVDTLLRKQEDRKPSDLTGHDDPEERFNEELASMESEEFKKEPREKTASVDKTASLPQRIGRAAAKYVGQHGVPVEVELEKDFKRKLEKDSEIFKNVPAHPTRTEPLRKRSSMSTLRSSIGMDETPPHPYMNTQQKDKTAAELRSTLLPHQQRVVKRMREQPGLVVAHGTGSGKTLSSIGAIVDLNPNKARVLVPAALQENYRKEIHKHVKGQLPVEVGSLQKAVKDGKPPRGDILVVDEAHRIRNPQSKGRRLVSAAEVDKRMLLTASPVYNLPEDVAPLVNIAAGNKVLPEGGEFRKRFVEQPSRSLLSLINPWAQKEPRIVRKDELGKVLTNWVDFHGGNEDGFPDMAERRVNVPMTMRQSELHDEAWGKLPFALKLRLMRGMAPGSKDLASINQFQSQTRQISSSEKKYVEDPEPSPKLTTAVDNLKSRLQKNPRHKAVVYANYLTTLDDYSGHLDNEGIPYAVFRGDTPKKVRDQNIRDYNAGKLKALLVSGAGGEGLDLKGTRQVQVLEPHWNEEKLRQVIGRARRFQSHAHLPEDEQNIEVERYAARPVRWFGDNKGVEDILYDTAERKQRLNDQVLDLMTKTGSEDSNARLVRALPKYLYHGSPVDFDELKNLGEGVHFTVAPGLASAFAIKREDIVKGRTGKVRNAQKIWNKPIEELDEPIKHHRIAVLASPRAKNPIVPGERGRSAGYVYKVQTDDVKEHLHVNPPEPREVIFTGDKAPVVEKIPVKLTWETVRSPEIRGGAGVNTFARSLNKSAGGRLYHYGPKDADLTTEGLLTPHVLGGRTLEKYRSRAAQALDKPEDRLTPKDILRWLETSRGSGGSRMASVLHSPIGSEHTKQQQDYARGHQLYSIDFDRARKSGDIESSFVVEESPRSQRQVRRRELISQLRDAKGFDSDDARLAFSGTPHGFITLREGKLKGEYLKKEGAARARRRGEFAPGIPTRQRIKPIPRVDKDAPNEQWDVVASLHPARVRGDHIDLRLVDNKGNAHSWALGRELPEAGKSTYAVQMPTHSGRYAMRKDPFTIPEGYGATRPGAQVRPVFIDKAEVVEAGSKKVRFLRHHGQETDEFVLKRIGPDDDKPVWVMNNTTKTRATREGAKLPDSKPKMREVAPGQIDYKDDAQVMTAKLDGAHAVVHLHGRDKPMRVYSYRRAQRPTGLIDHTYKFPEYHTRKSPDSLKNTVVRAEVWASDSKGKAVPPSELGGVLNSSVPRARRKLEEKGLRLRLTATDVIKHKGKSYENKPYAERLEALREISNKMDGTVEAPIVAVGELQKRHLMDRITKGTLKETKEGVVLQDLDGTGPATKVKLKPSHDVFVRGVFNKPRGEARGHAGGFEYSWSPEGDIVGRVGTGFDHRTRKKMLEEPEQYVGRVAKVESQDVFQNRTDPSQLGALRSPSFLEWHLDKTGPELMKEAALRGHVEGQRWIK